MKIKTLFVCQSCGTQSPKWTVRCPGCQSWNTFVEETAPSGVEKRTGIVFKDEPVLLNEGSTEQKERWTTGIGEFDRVVGGRIVQGSVTLIGGDPGIGKSTLSLQVASALSQIH